MKEGLSKLGPLRGRGRPSTGDFLTVRGCALRIRGCMYMQVPYYGCGGLRLGFFTVHICFHYGLCIGIEETLYQ